MHARALRCVLHGFNVSHESDVSWRLEDFTSDAEIRLALVDDLLDGESAHIDAPVSVTKTRFGWGNGVHAISCTEYPSILTDEEIAALDRPDVRLAYPNWIESLDMMDKDSDERMRVRARAVVELAYAEMKRRACGTSKILKLRSVEEALDCYFSNYPIAG